MDIKNFIIIFATTQLFIITLLIKEHQNKVMGTKLKQISHRYALEILDNLKNDYKLYIKHRGEYIGIKTKDDSSWLKLDKPINDGEFEEFDYIHLLNLWEYDIYKEE